ncbi:hypothetical protein [Mycoplana rhizolycopersici]|uniref:Uncharacterized protein n=1 Tax=Mycoplana rhizolycopersici TaxID=2746702 RepID=A0ABX2QEA8_9HYPH|nr:hypothetical protein [Rhizobium rhizolycopersici]NVP56062.1 hypothetical protein [Rhizobium rhizolycopersici]
MIRYITRPDIAVAVSPVENQSRRSPDIIDRQRQPGFILPSNEWYSVPLAEAPQVSSGLGAFMIGIIAGSILSSSMIALGAWLF